LFSLDGPNKSSACRSWRTTASALRWRVTDQTQTQQKNEVQDTGHKNTWAGSLRTRRLGAFHGWEIQTVGIVSACMFRCLASPIRSPIQRLGCCFTPRRELVRARRCVFEVPLAFSSTGCIEKGRMHARARVHVHVHVHVPVYVHARARASARVSASASASASASVSVSVSASARARVCVCTHVHVCVCARAHTHGGRQMRRRVGFNVQKQPRQMTRAVKVIFGAIPS
jgi:hypothetical protein